MSKTAKVSLWIAIPIMILTISIGYAAISEDLFLHGNANIEPSEYIGVYISDAEVVQSTNLSVASSEYILPTNYSLSANPKGINASVTCRLTIHNNTDVTYWYLGQDILDQYGSNSLIGQSGGITVVTKDKLTDTGATFNQNDWIPPQTTRDIYVTYTFGSLAQGTISTLVNFKFGLKMDAVYDQFLAVLNDTSPGGGYDQLTSAFDDQYADGDGCVIGNVGQDKALLEGLFGSDIKITVNGVEVPVTVMIRRDNIDGDDAHGDNYSNGGPTGCEYTVYITTDSLSSAGGKATVHAISYSKLPDGSWYRIGQLYEGTATVKDYDSSEGYDGAFDVYSWLATPNSYEVTDGITYRVGQPNGDQYEILKSLEQIISVEDQNFFNTIDNTNIFKKVYDILKDNTSSNDPSIIGLRTAFENAAPFYNNLNNGQEFKVKRECTRAEIIPYLIDIQHALDYYYQVEHSAK